jgi:hypothetical protein
MDRDRNIAMGLGSDTYTAATIIGYQELTAHFGPNYHAKFILHILMSSTPIQILFENI